MGIVSRGSLFQSSELDLVGERVWGLYLDRDCSEGLRCNAKVLRADSLSERVLWLPRNQLTFLALAKSTVRC